MILEDVSGNSPITSFVTGAIEDVLTVDELIGVFSRVQDFDFFEISDGYFPSGMLVTHMRTPLLRNHHFAFSESSHPNCYLLYVEWRGSQYA